MKFLIVVLLAIIAMAAAFAPKQMPRVASRALAMKTESNPMKFAIPAAAMTFLAPFAALAAEGTGRAFGIDDNRLIWAAILPSIIIFPLYNQWSSQQEKDDFFDTYERRRTG